MHTLVQMQYLTRKEFERGLVGLTDEDARKRIEPMNCITWMIGHVANQQHDFFVAWPQGKETVRRYQAYRWGAPRHSRPLMRYCHCGENHVMRQMHGCRLPLRRV